jgi:hypothetical protein
MDEEIASIVKNDTLKLVPIPNRKKPIVSSGSTKKRRMPKKRWRGIKQG